MKLTIEKRFSILFLFIISLFIILILRIGYMTIIKGEEYYQTAENKVYKKINYEAPRGEIRDRNGVLLAGNRPSFVVQISENESDREKLNEIAKKTMKILRNNQEQVVDEFPIVIENGQYRYTFDQRIEDWKRANGVEIFKNAKESFYAVANMLHEQAAISLSPEDNEYDIQKKINEQNYYLPISVAKWKFIDEMKKEEWFAQYGIRESDFDISAKDAYHRLREYYKIDSSLTDIQARDILLVRDLAKSKGYLQYEPTTLASDVSQTTVSIIEESAIDLPGISVKIEPVRYYPNGNFASHILGQIGRISTQAEIDKYVKEKGYTKSEIIGKSGIEGSFESILRGEPGYREVQVDAKGRLISNIGSKDPVSGKTVYSTIDFNVQKAAEDSLEKTLKLIQVGGVYESPWGNVRLRTNSRVYNKATSGAVVALDVKTGDVLALASYPDYDPNLFARGISQEEQGKLMPKSNNPLAPKPLYNIATMTAVQPGSTFKMLTGLAALEAGLDPEYKIKCDGFVLEGGRPIKCWIYGEYGGKHDYENLVAALKDSCNYYFYSVSVGYNYFTKQEIPLREKMTPENILEAAKRFGLDEKTGIQIEEVRGRVPNEEILLESKKRELYYDIAERMKDYFVDINSSNALYEQRIREIVSWTEENPSRRELIKRMKDLNVKPELVEPITDHVKFSYYVKAKWNRGDVFNLAIGQGAHAYTPIQIANYVSAIANNGRLNKVTVVDKIESYDTKEIQEVKNSFEDIDIKDRRYLDYLRRGMIDVTDEGTAKDTFKNFPIKVAAKTGTAQKEGKIPSENEEVYLLSHLSSYQVKYKDVFEKLEEYGKDPKIIITDDNRHRYIRKAIKELNPNIRDKEINAYKDDYDNFAWFVSYAPADDPQIAVATLIFQGGQGGFGATIIRDVIGAYFGLNGEDQKVIEEKSGSEIQTPFN